MNWKPALLSVCCVIICSTALFSLENPFSTSTPDLAIAADCDTMLPDTINAVLCDNEEVVLNPGDGFECYVWSTNDTTQFITISELGIYSVSVCYQDSCIAEIVFDVDSSDLSVEITGDSTICEGEIDTLWTETTGNVISYVWNSGVSTPYHIFNDRMFHSVTVEDVNGCIATDFFLVEPVEVHIQEEVWHCEGDTPTVSATSGFVSYLWSNGDTTQTIELPPGNGSYEYSVTATDAEGCVVSDTAEILVLVITLPSIEIPGLTVHNCSGFELPDFPPGMGFELIWTLNDSSIVDTVSISGEYCYVILETASGCTDQGDCFTVDIEAGLDIMIEGLDEICINDEVTLCGTEGYLGYVWNTGETDACITVDSESLYCVTVTSSGDCTASFCLYVNEQDFPDWDVEGEFSFCNEDTTVLCVTNSEGLVDYSWNTGLHMQCAITWIPGTYCVTVTDINGCTDFKCFQVSNTPPVEIIDTLITDDSGSSDGSITPVFDTLNVPVSFLWSTGSTNSTIENLTAGTYTLTVTDSYGCTFEFEFIVEMVSAQYDPERSDNLLRIANNPAGDYWEISKIQPGMHQNALLSLTSPDGKTVWESTFFNASITIPAKQLPPGVYYLLMKSGDRLIGTIPLVRTK